MPPYTAAKKTKKTDAAATATATATLLLLFAASTCEAGRPEHAGGKVRWVGFLTGADELAQRLDAPVAAG